MKLGIIGKPQCGKTTVFNAAAGQQEAVGDYSQAVHRAVIKVPDERPFRVAELVKPKKVTPAEIEFLDAPGFTGKGKESKGLEVTPELHQMDAFIMVVDAFSPEANPETDIQNLIDEMIILDQVMVETNINKRERRIKLTGDKSEIRELELLKRCLTVLEEERPLIDMELAEEDARLLRGFMFLSQKPLLIVLNIPEEALGEAEDIAQKHSHFVDVGKRELAVMCGKIEMELVSLEEEERQAFLNELGIKTPAVQQVIQKSYALLGLISFFTANENEVRAWPVSQGIIAVKAAGVVHSDMERGFIRAEVVRFDDYMEYKTSAALKAAGRMRLEGKEYVVEDGDVIQFRFNV